MFFSDCQCFPKFKLFFNVFFFCIFLCHSFVFVCLSMFSVFIYVFLFSMFFFGFSTFFYVLHFYVLLCFLFFIFLIFHIFKSLFNCYPFWKDFHVVPFFFSFLMCFSFVVELLHMFSVGR